MKVRVLLLFFVIIFYCFISNRIFSQNYVKYYNLVNEAEWLLYNDKIDSSIILYKKAFIIGKSKPIDHYRLAEAYMLKGENKKAYKELLHSSQKDLDVEFWIKRNKESILYNRYLSDSSFKIKIRNLNKKYILRHNAKKNKRVTDTISYFKHADQRYRIMSDSIKSFGEHSPQYILFKQEWIKNDSIVGNQLYSYLTKNRFPDIYLYGEQLFIVLVHLHCSAYHRIRPILYEQMLKGWIPSRYYATMVDRAGCGCDGNTTFLEYELFKCTIEPNTAIEHRKKIGLSIYFKDNYVFPTDNHRWLFPDNDTTFYHK